MVEEAGGSREKGKDRLKIRKRAGGGQVTLYSGSYGN